MSQLGFKSPSIRSTVLAARCWSRGTRIRQNVLCARAVGGNHEAANHLWELYYGGWAAPNIYYLGHAGVVNFGGLRIAGLSGIWNSNHYMSGHYERPPYDQSTVRSAYHVRDLEVYRLLKVRIFSLANKMLLAALLASLIARSLSLHC